VKSTPVSAVLRPRRFPDRKVSGRVRAPETAEQDEAVAAARQDQPLQVAVPEAEGPELIPPLRRSLVKRTETRVFK
jgi:hypothetical protein